MAAPAANCNATVTGWIDIPGADVTTGSFAWTVPGHGYFCLRGIVTDGAGQTTTAIAGRPIKFGMGGPPGGP